MLLERAGYEVTIRKRPRPISFTINVNPDVKAINEAFRKMGEALKIELEKANEAFARFGRSLAHHQQRSRD